MTALALTITTAGLAAAVNAANTGLGPIVISQIALGSSTYAPAVSQTAMAAEVKRINTFGAAVVDDNTLHVTITDTSADTYTLGEVGLYTNTGVLFAVYSQATPILEKGAQQIVLLSADILLTSVPPDSVTIGDADFMLPPATTTRQGIIEIATSAEVDTGTDTARAVTPAGLKRRIDTRAPAARTLTAGNGLTGGGDLTADRTIAIGTPGTISGSSSNAVTATSHTHAVSFPVTSVAGKTGAVTLTVGNVSGAAASARTITAGNGLTGGGDLTADRTLTLGTPGTLSGSTTNAVTATSHTHAISAATSTLRGVVELATSAETRDGEDAARAVTPAALASFAKSLAANGYCTLPGGLVVQWGTATPADPAAVTFPLAFPNACRSVTATYANGGDKITLGASNISKTGFQLYGWEYSANWIAVGY